MSVRQLLAGGQFTNLDLLCNTVTTTAGPSPTPGAQNLTGYRRSTWAIPAGGATNLDVVEWDDSQVVQAYDPFTTVVDSSNVANSGGNLSLTAAGQSGLIVNTASICQVDMTVTFGVASAGGTGLIGIAMLRPGTAGATQTDDAFLNMVPVPAGIAAGTSLTLTAGFIMNCPSGTLVAPRLAGFRGTSSLQVRHTSTRVTILHLT